MALFISLLCIIVAIWLLLQFAPQAYLEILIHEPAPDDRFLTATLSIRNTSRARMRKQTVLLQSLAYDHDKAIQLPDSVPFRTSSVRSGDEPLEWHEPKEVFKDVHYLFPGETLTSECLVPLPAEADIVHIGLQFNAAPPPLENLMGRFFTLNNSWETAAFKLLRRTD
ncbi:MAG: hypothetical protein C0624_11015 [Desulfuromonas sp.]|nr:MAG: hypothetical protein C0624_11015 [Desulfuromonas sp.]